MSICYLTGNLLEEKTSGPPKDDTESLEHVIPNALGGRLKSSRILSHKANQDLNDSIDKKFTKIFENFCLRLDIQKDRKTTASLNAAHAKYNIDVIFKNDKYFPRKPFFDPDKNCIYADSIKTGENYKKYLIKSGEALDEKNIQIYDDISGLININFNLDNNIFKKGFAKIAAGFAAMHNISRENLKGVIDLKKNVFHDRIVLAPSVPINMHDYDFEKNAYKNDHYPIHALVLSGSRNERLLYCHVELFSTFQWYVILDDDYHGEDIYYNYAQHVCDGMEIGLSKYADQPIFSSRNSNRIVPYRSVSLNYFNRTKHIHKYNSFKAFNHRKFHSLSAFSNFVFLNRKIKTL